MTSPTSSSSFIGASVEEVQLSSAPLISVICQVRWPQFTAMSDGIAGIAVELGKSISAKYPLSNQHKEMQYQLSVQGLTQSLGEDIFEWISADDSWSVLLSQRYVAFQSKSYTNRQDFFNRMTEVLDILVAIVPIPVVERIGFRYTNRISEERDFHRLHELIEPQVLGASQLSGEVTLVHSLNEAVYTVQDSQLRVRSAELPPGGTIDPAIAPVDARSWLLDIDASKDLRDQFNVASVSETGHRLSSIAYSYFRWAVKDEFITHFGGVNNN
jgi:uncharacterized protein (TIGR04255 family)